MPKLLTQERFTVLASATVAMAILGAAVTAQPSRNTPGDRLERLESDLRYQLELEAKVNPPAYAARTKELGAVLDAWRKSPQSASDYQRLTAWMREALSRSLPGDSGEWPAAPMFSAVAQSEHETRKLVAAEKPVMKKPEPAPVIAPAEMEQPKSKQADVKHVGKAKPSGHPTPSAPQTAEGVVTPNTALVKPFIVHISEPVPLGAETRATEKPAEPERSVVARHESTAAAAAANVAEWPAPTPDQTAEVYHESASEAPVAKPQAAERPRVQVNLAELNARIGGYHDGLREVEAAVVAGREGMSAGEVAKLVMRLELLAGQYHFVRLYYQSLTPGEREFVLEPRSMADTIELVDQQRSRAESESEEDHFSPAEGSHGTELSRRLQQLLKATGE